MVVRDGSDGHVLLLGRRVVGDELGGGAVAGPAVREVWRGGDGEKAGSVEEGRRGGGWWPAAGSMAGGGIVDVGCGRVRLTAFFLSGSVAVLFGSSGTPPPRLYRAKCY